MFTAFNGRYTSGIFDENGNLIIPKSSVVKKKEGFCQLHSEENYWVSASNPNYVYTQRNARVGGSEKVVIFAQ